MIDKYKLGDLIKDCIAKQYSTSDIANEVLHVVSLSPYEDYTWEDVAMLAQENKILKEEIITLGKGIQQLQKTAEDYIALRKKVETTK